MSPVGLTSDAEVPVGSRLSMSSSPGLTTSGADRMSCLANSCTADNISCSIAGRRAQLGSLDNHSWRLKLFQMHSGRSRKCADVASRRSLLRQLLNSSLGSLSGHLPLCCCVLSLRPRPAGLSERGWVSLTVVFSAPPSQ